jgi:hypothetical protein
MEDISMGGLMLAEEGLIEGASYDGSLELALPGP